MHNVEKFELVGYGKIKRKLIVGKLAPAEDIDKLERERTQIVGLEIAGIVGVEGGQRLSVDGNDLVLVIKQKMWLKQFQNQVD